MTDSGFPVFGSVPSSSPSGSFTATKGRKFVRGRFVKFRPLSSSTVQSNTNSCEINGESGHGAERTDEVVSNLQTGNMEAEIAGKESNNTSEVGALASSLMKLEEEAREANQEPAKISSLVVISRILKGIPQNPHFYQLRNHSELVRKSMICLWDQIFEETAEQIHSLQANGFWVRAKELWKTMEDLQTIGYNVIPLRRRLVELSDVMKMLELSKSSIELLKIKAENHRAEKSRIEFMFLSLQEMFKKEKEGMEIVVAQVIDMEKVLTKFDEAFAELALEQF
ncbi:hypothetical protein GH714_013043 [Hevea brasiliensis]|uniref:Uncharacterized protein n=1 Tax=Hevea brasiliensis TaxID=3981 RepID=A0A6A6MYP4_HEVBR|nr:hypothetical protein GH714_013043 [Hevea brasiliensis]